MAGTPAFVMLELLENPAAPYGRKARKSILGADVGGFQQQGQRLTVGLADLRPPDLEQQDDSLLIRPVPRLMLHAVVEDQQLTFPPLSLTIADAQRAVGRDDQRQVADQPEVEQAVVRP